MQPFYPPPHPRRIVAQLLTFALLLIAVATLTTARVDAREPASLIAGSDLGVSPDLVANGTSILSPSGTLTGPAGVDAFIDTLRRDYPEARFETGETHIVGGLIIVDWQGTVDGNVAVSGRTLITIADGHITRLSFLNLNVIAPADGKPITIV